MFNCKIRRLGDIIEMTWDWGCLATPVTCRVFSIAVGAPRSRSWKAVTLVMLASAVPAFHLFLA